MTKVYLIKMEKDLKMVGWLMVSEITLLAT